MSQNIVNQVLAFYDELFSDVFSKPFNASIGDRYRQRLVSRQVEAAADAASQSLARLFENEKLSDQQVEEILRGYASVRQSLLLETVANFNVTPESIVESLLGDYPCPEAVTEARKDAIFRVGLHSVVQVLMLVGPVMAEWQKLGFSSTFDLPRRVVNRLNEITQQMGAIRTSGLTQADERYELTYRDYLLQRFHRVEAGTVRMTTNMAVDLTELFVMPRVNLRPKPEKNGSISLRAGELMNLAEARRIFYEESRQLQPKKKSLTDSPSAISEKSKADNSMTALDLFKRYPRVVIVGTPGAGKSTFLEWLQLQLASANEMFPMGGEQAIPLFLRIRQLDPRHLPQGASLIQQATASEDRAKLMPPGWIDRQLKAGRVIVMVDGLDETEPELRDQHVLPWLKAMCETYTQCRYVISSRPVGYSPGALRALGFEEADLADFNTKQICEYTRHWCTAVRLARNELPEEARREGEADGDRIVSSFEENRYIKHLARNPLMLSAVCLVNYFEGGNLPKDRAILYRLCVEGLLHHWDQRRGIHSEFRLDEKLRACREVALTMQASDRAEWESDMVLQVFSVVLGDHGRAAKLLEHIRYRTGLLLERRPRIFAFAHLTFQEYLSAQAVHEGNRQNVDIARLAKEHNDGRWQEVIALFCGLAPAPAARDLIQKLIDQLDSEGLADVLTEAYCSAGEELQQDPPFRQRVIERIAIAPLSEFQNELDRFPDGEVAPIANRLVGCIASDISISNSHNWLREHRARFNIGSQKKKLRSWRKLTSNQTAELVHLLHMFGTESTLKDLAKDAAIYSAPGPKFGGREEYSCLAEIALIGIGQRKIIGIDSTPLVSVLIRIFEALAKCKSYRAVQNASYILRFVRREDMRRPRKVTNQHRHLARLVRAHAERLTTENLGKDGEKLQVRVNDSVSALMSWAKTITGPGS